LVLQSKHCPIEWKNKLAQVCSNHYGIEIMQLIAQGIKKNRYIKRQVFNELFSENWQDLLRKFLFNKCCLSFIF
jgi:hypothetical protein